MRPSTLLFAAVSAVQAEATIDLRGRAAPFEAAERYAVMSCSQVDRCGGQCAEIWCDGDEVGECMSETTQVVQVAEHCALCASGDLLLSRNVFQVLSGVETAWIGVGWRCVSCETSSGSTGSGDDELRVIEQAVCPGPAAAESSGVISSVENTANGAIQDGSASGEALPFGGVGSSENDTFGSFDAEIAVPMASSTYSGSESESESYSSSSSGSSSSSSGPAQADTKPWNGQGEKTAPPMPYEPVPTIPPYSPSSSSYASSDGASATSLPDPANTPSSTSSTNGGGSSSSEPPVWISSSGGYGPSVSPTASTSSTASSIDSDTKYPAGTVVAPAGQDTRSASPGSSASTTAETTDKEVSTTASPAPSPGNTDNSSSDGNLSATAAVTKSPFFYAAVLLAIAGLVGVVVGYRAKQKRNHHDELRAIRMSARQSSRAATPASTPWPAPASPALSHGIVIL